MSKRVQTLTRQLQELLSWTFFSKKKLNLLASRNNYHNHNDNYYNNNDTNIEANNYNNSHNAYNKILYNNTVNIEKKKF